MGLAALIVASTQNKIAAAAAVMGFIFASAAGISARAYKALADARGEQLDDERKKVERLEARVEQLEETVDSLLAAFRRLEGREPTRRR